MTNHGQDDDIPHERRSKLSNIVVGKAKEVLGRLTHEDDLIAEGRLQEQVAAQDVEPELSESDDAVRSEDFDGGVDPDDGPAGTGHGSRSAEV